MAPPGHSNRIGVNPEITKTMENAKNLKQVPQYGSINGGSSSDSCPTCKGTGRIPRGQQDQLLAVIPCNDVRLQPRRTKLYVCISMGLSIFLCGLILFFFPRSVTLTPVSVLSVMVYFTPDSVEMEVKNLFNMTNENFVPVQIAEFSMQGVVNEIVAGHTKITNMTAIQLRSQKPYIVQINLLLEDTGLNNYCKSSTIKIHTLFLKLQITMNIAYLSHTEQLSQDVFEYIDCGNNSTTPHPVRS
ncbi:transmembrane protein 106A [Poeciliopsis prolifica]|uniref:transmembrane protein 106A n=1 Tax=Poeciliopsis prolifica TaxID=188132 RepID=UPI00241342A7|nr:transmembrane protein 106A [Poeciliopsis prolifica]XP_054898868.1 transmembrane protein 106A [Poeciliopsis prolifica]